MKLRLGKLELWEIVAWIVIIIIMVIAFMAEKGETPCYESGKNCAVNWQWEPQEGDGLTETIQRIENADDSLRNIIVRRIAMLAGFGSALIILWYFRKKPIPPVLEFVLIGFIITSVVWLAFRFHESHRLFPISTRMKRPINELRYQLDISERPNI